MVIRKYEEKDREQVIYICLNDMFGKYEQSLIDYVEWMFCRYYIEVEPQNCFVAVDENDKPVGYCYGVADYDEYQKNFEPYIRKVESLNDRAFLKDALTEMYDHAIYKRDYPAHLHIDILPDYQSKGIGSRLIDAFCNNLKAQSIKGVMLIVGTENEGARRFYERNGFTLLQDIKTGAAYGKDLTEE